MSPKFTNSVLIDNGADAAIFDPWGHVADWEKLLKERGLTLRAIYCTHGHPDHIAAAPALSAATGAPWRLAAADFPQVELCRGHISPYGLPEIDAALPRPEELPAGKTEILPGLSAEVIATPGHTPGGLCFYFDAADGRRFLVSGDTLFYNTVGRTDFPGGNESDMRASVRLLREYGFPGDTMVIPGHGRTGSFSEAEKSNKFLQSW